MTTKLTFLGAVGTVTGSKYLLENQGHRILIDCGLFQGFKALRLRNWAPLPVDPRTIDAVLLTHAHLDHSGYLPLLVKDGFLGPVLSTPATRDLCGVLLPDSGHLQEKDADFANRHGFSKHRPALPLYIQNDAELALRRFRAIDFEAKFSVGGYQARFLYAGHILGVVAHSSGQEVRLRCQPRGRPKGRAAQAVHTPAIFRLASTNVAFDGGQRPILFWSPISPVRRPDRPIS